MSFVRGLAAGSFVGCLGYMYMSGRFKSDADRLGKILTPEPVHLVMQRHEGTQQWHGHWNRLLSNVKNILGSYYLMVIRMFVR